MAKKTATKDVYLDADGNLTDSEKDGVQQIAFKGAVLSSFAQERWGISEDGSYDSKAAKKTASADEDDAEDNGKKASKKAAK